MPIDAGIYSQQILPPALDPAKIQAGVIAQQDQIDAAKAKQQDLRDSLLARSILQSTGGDPDKAVSALRQSGLYGAAASIEKSQNDAAKARGEAMKARLDNEKTLIERASEELAAAMQNPSQSSFDTLRKNLAALPDDPDDPQAKQRILSDIGETFDPATTPQKLQQWSMRSTAALAQTQQQQKTLDNVLGQNHLLGATAMLADASDAADYGKEYQAVMAILPFGTEREAIRAKLPDPSQVTDANFGQVKQALVAGSMTPQEQTNRMNAETAAENAKKEPAGFTLGQGQTRFGPDGKPLASVAPRQVASGSSTSLSGGQKSGLSDEALNQAADKYFASGVLPPLGMGTQAAMNRQAIMNRAAELHPGAKLAVNSAEYKANQSELTKLSTQLDAVKAFESTGLKNLKMFTDAAAKIPDTGIPWLNTPVRALSISLVGSENMAAVNAARQVALTEIARVVNNPNLTGTLSDSAREEVSSLSPKNATFNQIKRVAAVLEQDMANRRTGLEAQKADIESRLGKAPSTQGGKVRVTGRDGKTYEFPDQKSADAFKKAGG